MKKKFVSILSPIKKNVQKTINALDDHILTTNITDRHNTKTILLENKYSEMPDIRLLAKGIYTNYFQRFQQFPRVNRSIKRLLNDIRK